MAEHDRPYRDALAGAAPDMKGRIYDPLAGRFTTADPVTQAPYWSQGLNRYSYVFNDPVNNTDPSGFMANGADSTAGIMGWSVGTLGLLAAQGYGLGAAFGGLGAGANLGSWALSSHFGGPSLGGGKPGVSYDVPTSGAPSGSGVSSLSPQAKAATTGGINELALPDTSVPDWVRGPDARLAQNYGYATPGQDCDAETGVCHPQILVVIPEGDVARAEAAIGNALSRALQGLRNLLRPRPIGADFVRRSLSGLRSGRSPGVKVVDSAAKLRELFDRLSAGGEPIQGTTYPGELVEQSDGTTIGIRGGSKSGGPAMDISLPGNEFWKVHVQ